MPTGPALAANGGGSGSGGSSIWSWTWWAGSPQGPGPYKGSSGGSSICVWHDVGPSVVDLNGALGNAGLPSSFWTAPLGGGHPGIWGVDAWATRVAKGAPAWAHFDLVACPQPDQVPPTGGDVESSFPVVVTPGGQPMHLWVFWDTVPDPAPGHLPPLIGEAFASALLPSPSISTAPASINGIADATIVNLPTYLWINPSAWRTVSATAAGGGLVATVWATPLRVVWQAAWDFPNPADDPQGGVTLAPEVLDLTCPGPGAPSSDGSGSLSEGAACESTFTQSTFGTSQRLVASIVWQVHWALSDSAGVVGGEGLLPDSVTASVRPLRVLQVESVITNG